MQSKALDAARLAAFALRLASSAQFLDAGGAMGMLAVLEKLLRCFHLLGYESLQLAAALACILQAWLSSQIKVSLHQVNVLEFALEPICQHQQSGGLLILNGMYCCIYLCFCCSLDQPAAA